MAVRLARRAEGAQRSDDMATKMTGDIAVIKLAGEAAQKSVSYGYRLAIIGSFSGCKSKLLRDCIYECNKGNHLSFVADEDEAVRKSGGQGR